MLYGNTHRFLLRTIASQSVMSLEETKKVLVKQAGNEQMNIHDVLKEINEKIKPLKQQIKVVKDEITSEELVVFLSLGYDDTSLAQNLFLPVEMEFFRLLMEKILSTDTREITELTALNLRNNVKVNSRILHIEDAERLLNVWCRMKYLDHEDKNFVLGVRAIHEFESFFIQNLGDNMKCYLCTTIVFRGYNCPYCPKTVHNRCLEVHLKKAKTWPCCKSEYVHSDLQELRGESSRANEMARMSQQLESTQLIPNTNTTATSSDESTDEMEVEEISTASLRRPTKRMRVS